MKLIHALFLWSHHLTEIPPKLLRVEGFLRLLHIGEDTVWTHDIIEFVEDFFLHEILKIYVDIDKILDRLVQRLYHLAFKDDLDFTCVCFEAVLSL